MRTNKQSGFTLIEISIVLVIIGLLVGLIMQGQQLIDSAKVASAITTSNDLSLATKTFREKYKYWPGDHPNASTVIPNLPAACNIATTVLNIGNGAIDTPTEISCAIEELFQAGLIRADLEAGATYHTMRVDSGPIRLLSASASNVTTFAIGVNVVEFSNLPCRFAQTMDGKIDDGDISSASSGKARASVASCIVGGANDPVPFYAIAAN